MKHSTAAFRFARQSILVAAMMMGIYPAVSESGERRVQTRDGSAQVTDGSGQARSVKVNPTGSLKLSDDVIVTPDLIYVESFIPVIVDENNEAPEGAPPAPYNYAIVFSDGSVVTKETSGSPLVFWGKLKDFKENYYYKSRDLLPLTEGSGFFHDAWFRATREPVVASYTGSWYGGNKESIPLGSFSTVPEGCSTGGWTTQDNAQRNIRHRWKIHSADTTIRAFSAECKDLAEEVTMGPVTVSAYPAFVVEESIGNNGGQQNGISVFTKTAFMDVNEEQFKIPDKSYFYDPQDTAVTEPTQLDSVKSQSPDQAVAMEIGQERSEVPGADASGTWNVRDDLDVRAMLIYMGSRNIGVSACIKGYRSDGTMVEWRTPHTSDLEQVWTNMKFGKLCTEVHEKIANGIGSWFIANTASAIFGYEVLSETSSVWRIPKTVDDFVYIERAMNGAEYVNLDEFDISGKTAMFLLSDIKIKE